MSRDIREIVREEPLRRDQLLDSLRAEPLTVPELAKAVAQPQDEVMIWIMGMRKYGYVAEQGSADSDGFFHYAVVKGR